MSAALEFLHVTAHKYKLLCRMYMKVLPPDPALPTSEGAMATSSFMSTWKTGVLVSSSTSVKYLAKRSMAL
eukprot:5731130-Ditylum_brightwellii.AAC.1